MLTLVYKDLVCQKRNLWLVFAYAVLMHLAFFSLSDYGAYLAGAVAITYNLVTGQCAQEENSKADILINSLPVGRDTVVKAKYLAACAFTLLGLFASALVGSLIHYLGFDKSPADLHILVLMGAVSVFLWSVFYPVYFKFGYIKARYYNLILFLLVMFGSFQLVERFSNSWSDGWAGLATSAASSDFIPAVLLLGVSFLLGSVSMGVSLWIYRGREFS
ncbi:MAG TPA: ABC-2 transporter permease [Clostridia bacterium]|nr:ABC-2 transporter permease [Clostridia bacterium]